MQWWKKQESPCFSCGECQNVNIVVEQHEFAESKRDQTSGGNAGEIDMDTEFLDISKMSEEELPFR